MALIAKLPVNFGSQTWPVGMCVVCEFLRKSVGLESSSKSSLKKTQNGVNVMIGIIEILGPVFDCTAYSSRLVG